MRKSSQKNKNFEIIDHSRSKSCQKKEFLEYVGTGDTSQIQKRDRRSLNIPENLFSYDFGKVSALKKQSGGKRANYVNTNKTTLLQEPSASHSHLSVLRVASPEPLSASIERRLPDNFKLFTELYQQRADDGSQYMYKATILKLCKKLNEYKAKAIQSEGLRESLILNKRLLLQSKQAEQQLRMALHKLADRFNNMKKAVFEVVNQLNTEYCNIDKNTHEVWHKYHLLSKAMEELNRKEWREDVTIPPLNFNYLKHHEQDNDQEISKRSNDSVDFTSTLLFSMPKNKVNNAGDDNVSDYSHKSSQKSNQTSDNKITPRSIISNKSEADFLTSNLLFLNPGAGFCSTPNQPKMPKQKEGKRIATEPNHEEEYVDPDTLIKYADKLGEYISFRNESKEKRLLEENSRRLSENNFTRIYNNLDNPLFDQYEDKLFKQEKGAFGGE